MNKGSLDYLHTVMVTLKQKGVKMNKYRISKYYVYLNILILKHNVLILGAIKPSHKLAVVDC